MRIAQIVYKGKTAKGHNLVIRYPNKHDAQAMHDYINTLSKEKTFIRFQGEQISRKEEVEYLNSQLKKIKMGKTVQLLVFSQEKLIGVSGIDTKDKIETHVGSFGISLARDFRGEGLGKLLMELILKEAKENMPQLKIVTLSLFANNERALGLYKRFGFIEYGRLPQGVKYKGKLVDQILMYKKIGSR